MSLSRVSHRCQSMVISSITAKSSGENVGLKILLLDC